MPRITSPYWNEKLGICEKHFVSQIPCQQCLAKHDEDIGVRLTMDDLEQLDAVGARELFREDLDWLVERIIA